MSNGPRPRPGPGRRPSAEADRGLNLREVGRYLGICAADIIESAGEPQFFTIRGITPRSQNVILEKKGKGQGRRQYSKYRLHAFTQEGVAMLLSVLRSKRTIPSGRMSGNRLEVACRRRGNFLEAEAI